MVAILLCLCASLFAAACSSSNARSDTDGGTDAGSSTAPTDRAGSGGGSGLAADWRPFSPASPWNTPIAANAGVDPNSGAMITDFANIPEQTTFWINIQDYSIPVYWVDSTAVPSVSVMASLGGSGFRTGAGDDSVAEGRGSAPIPSGAAAA